MALRQGITFKSINKNFEKCQISQEISHNVNERASASSSSVRKKPKLEDDEVEEKEVKEQEDNADEYEDLKNSYILTMSQTFSEKISEEDICDDEYTFEPLPENLDLTQLCDSSKVNPNSTIIIQTFKSTETFHSLQRTFEEIKPSYVIMYHSNMTAIRELEVNKIKEKRNFKVKK